MKGDRQEPAMDETWVSASEHQRIAESIAQSRGRPPTRDELDAAARWVAQTRLSYMLVELVLSGLLDVGVKNGEMVFRGTDLQEPPSNPSTPPGAVSMNEVPLAWVMPPSEEHPDHRFTRLRVGLDVVGSRQVLLTLLGDDQDPQACYKLALEPYDARALVVLLTLAEQAAERAHAPVLQ